MTTQFVVACVAALDFLLTFLRQSSKTKTKQSAGETRGLSASVLLVGALLLTVTSVARAQEVPAPTEPAEVATAEASDAIATSDAPATSDGAKPAQPAEATASSTELTGNFFQRLGKAYLIDWKGTSDSGPEPKYRGYPAPLTTPPYPFAVWPYGGSVTIGYPWTQSGPLMQAIWSGKDGEKWKKSGVQIYGWMNGGFNVSTSTNGHYANSPASYYIVPNSFQPDQMALYIERQPDTVQTDHFDWGFRITNIYGIDYRFTTSKGWFSSQLLGHVNSDGSLGYEYGYDMPMAYVDLYFPHVAQGLDVRIGRYISLPDIEAQLAPNNYTYSHSLLYSFDAYTQTGINLTFKLSDHWMYQAGISSGNDVAPWVGEPDAKPTFNTCLGYTWTKGGDSLYGCMNSLNSGKYAYNNLQAWYLTWYHKFNNKWHTSNEAWYMYEKDTPNVNNPSAAHLLIPNANGAVCNSSQQLTCFAPEWAVLNYVEREINKSNYLTFRNEFFDDMRGQRTGFRTKYYEGFLGWGHWIGTTMLFRPELRYEHAFDAPAYSSGTKKSQFVFASDIIFFF